MDIRRARPGERERGAEGRARAPERAQATHGDARAAQGQTVSAGRGGRGVSGDHIFSSW